VRVPPEQKVAGSNPARRTNSTIICQMQLYSSQLVTEMHELDSGFVAYPEPLESKAYSENEEPLLGKQKV